MRDSKITRVVSKVNGWLNSKNYTFSIEEFEKGYKLIIHQGSHERYWRLHRKEDFDANYARLIHSFVLDLVSQDFYAAVFGKVITVRLNILGFDEHPDDYLKKHNFNIVSKEPMPIGDCWILKIIDEGIPLTEHMTEIKTE